MIHFFEAQKKAHKQEPAPTYEERLSDLKKLRQMLSDHRDAIVDAICQDYGNRSYHETALAELIPAGGEIDHALKQLRGWMRTRHRHVDRTLYPGADNRVIPQPLGVIGLIMPWNFPVFLTFSQLICAFAAGNRAMVKMSENSIALSRLLIKISPDYFPHEKLVFLEETGSVGIAFSKLPFDLIIFTGSGATGRAVMASASQNLTPVILELGGKSPAIIDPRYPLAKAVERIMFAKQFNAGQICTNVDYVFLQEDQVEPFIELAREWVARHVPDIHRNDYTSIIDDRAYERINATVEDARCKGARIINLNGEQEAEPVLRKIPVQLILDTTPEMIIRKRETFGPLLLILSYKNPEDVIGYVNSGPEPLALYPFSHDRKLVQRYIDRIPSGGVTVNDALLHVVQNDLPFGGLGQSGMGHYHGREGFEACSKMRPVFHQARFSSFKFLAPPYGRRTTRIVNWLMKFKI